ncbi:MAG: nickel-dependent hydrogenase large subunit, partial [Mycobacterium leprae]
YLAERICGICGFVHSTTFCHAVEQAAGIEEQPRARYIRTILLELERIHSHLLWLGLAAHIVGFDTAFMQAWRVREPVMWAAEALTGNRKTYSMNCIGGVRRDVTAEGARSLRETLGQVERESRAIVHSLTSDTTLRLRLESVGVLSRAEAIRMAVIGPAARASGVPLDVRANFPYLAYPALGDFQPVLHTEGDIQARLEVRMTELFQSIGLIRAALDGMPEGPLVAPTVTIPAGRVGIALTEAPRGQCCHYVETGEEGRPYRWRVLAPTWMQLQAVPSLLGPESTVADFPIIAGSIDPCFSCTERLEVVRTGRWAR